MLSSRSLQLYIYYRVACDDLAQSLAAAGRMQSDLARRHPGLAVQLLVKRAPATAPSSAASHATLMEIYAAEDTAPAGGDLIQALAGEIEREAASCLGRWIDGVRHAEWFEPCA
ncbi:DUF4936 family protein [Aquincola sp. MAHUQ-54]|uniref:DUF4936 family protein n=1 Tax=Aquincola agrisoli TaxID=3119538 RepID=A0AAW9QK83_9BURK